MDKILITPEARERLSAYIQGCHQEISGLGTVEIENGNPLITEIFLFEQEVTGSSTDLCPNDVSSFLLEAVKTKVDVSKLKLWWHSHANMGVFWSGTDVGTIANCFRGCDWMVSVVGNHKGEFKCRLDLYEPFRLLCDNLPLSQKPNTSSLDVSAEIKLKVKTKVWAPTYKGWTPPTKDWRKGGQQGNFQGNESGQGKSRRSQQEFLRKNWSPGGYEAGAHYGDDWADQYEMLQPIERTPDLLPAARSLVSTETQAIRVDPAMAMSAKKFRRIRERK